MTTAATTASLLVPGDCLWDERQAIPMVVLLREMRPQDGRLHFVLALPDGSRISRTLTGTKELQIVTLPPTC